jgi:hypothetical protein
LPYVYDTFRLKPEATGVKPESAKLKPEAAGYAAAPGIECDCRSSAPIVRNAWCKVRAEGRAFFEKEAHCMNEVRPR